MATFLNELDPWKASCAMLVTDAGTATLSNEPHPRKALSSMLVTDVGMCAFGDDKVQSKRGNRHSK